MVANTRPTPPHALFHRLLLAPRAAPVLAPFPAALAPPIADPLVMAGQQNLRHVPSAVLGRAGVVGVLRIAPERGAEGLLEGRLLVPERARQLAQDRIAHDHRRQLAAGEDIAPDRDLLAGEVLEDALIKALIAAAQQRQRGLGRQLVDETVVKRPPPGRKRDHPTLLAQPHRVHTVVGAQRAVHDIDAQQHPRSAAKWRVIDLPAAELGVLAEVHALEARARFERITHVALGGEPLKPFREQCEHVDLHHRPPLSRAPEPCSPGPVSPRKPISTSICRSETAMRRIASLTIGTSSGSPPCTRRTSSASQEGSSIKRLTVPIRRSPSTTAQPSSSCAHHSPSASEGASSSCTVSAMPRSASAAARSSLPSKRTIGRSSVPARRTIAVRRSATVTIVPTARSRGGGAVT